MISFEEFRINIIGEVYSSLKAIFLNQGPCVFEPGLGFINGERLEFGFKKSPASMKTTFAPDKDRCG